MHQNGRFLFTHLPVKHIDVIAALFDTGASSSNYMSETFLQTNITVLQPYIRNHKSNVKLGDNKTMISITKILKDVTIAFTDTDGYEHLATTSFLILPSGNDVVIGLPTILTSLSSFFYTILMEAVNDLAIDSDASLSYLGDADNPLPSDGTPIINQHIQPFSNALQLAPEEQEDEEPAIFRTFSDLTALTPEEATAAFHDLMPSHIDPDFQREIPQIIQLLQTKGRTVFAIPQDWTGINGLEPLELRWSPDTPPSFRAARRPVNPRLLERAKAEFERMRGYIFVPSNSSYSHPLVIAPKPPNLVRICGSYDVFANKWILPFQYPIPYVQLSLQKAAGWNFFADVDMTNAFHQVPLGPITSMRLALTTPWGLVQPLFLPEGVSPASPYLQSIVMSIFADMESFAIVIFDNILLGASTKQELYNNLEKFIDRCNERNIHCNFKKTWIGKTSAKFFGYTVCNNSWSLDDTRKKVLLDIPFPMKLKQVQSFFGSSVFFRPFVPKFDEACQHLTDLLSKTFDWTEDTWSHDYRSEFEQLKLHLVDAAALYYPDYTLPWTTRLDACGYGVGGGVLQHYQEASDSPVILQPLGYVSKKLSPQAILWSTIEKEAYSMYHVTKSLSHLLAGKRFVLETDHANLVWMSKSQVPKIIRWFIYLQQFDFIIKHIPGKANIFGDWLSRLYHLHTCHQIEAINDMLIEKYSNTELTDPNYQMHHIAMLNLLDNISPQEALDQVHNATMGHHGIARTWRLLNKYFPGHGITTHLITDYINTCSTCQKLRLKHVPLTGFNRTLPHDTHRSTIGIDTLTVTPMSKTGHKYIIVIHNLFTKFCDLHKAKDKEATTLAHAMMRHFATYGLIDAIISDPGSDLMSKVIAQLNAWLGIRHIVSLVDRHESNGVERLNSEILRHISAIVHDKRLVLEWDTDTVLPLVQMVINEQPNSLLGDHSPMEATFGSHDIRYMTIDPAQTSENQYGAYITSLNDVLQTIRTVAHETNAVRAAKQHNHTPLDTANIYIIGDFVLRKQRIKPNKLSPKFLGPYEVIQCHKNDITCRHLVTHATDTYVMDTLQMYFGTREQAYEAALRDADQHLIRNIITHIGNPLKRTSLTFKVLFEDDDVIWKPYDKDLADSIHFETYCQSKPFMQHLLISDKAAKAQNTARLAIPIDYKVDDTIYVDLFAWAANTYHDIGLPDTDANNYFVAGVCTKLTLNKKELHINFPILKKKLIVNQSFLHGYAYRQVPQGSRIITQQDTVAYPRLLSL